jgi:nitrate reductase assembly molybdenum cofactor insertion protein NarJ
MTSSSATELGSVTGLLAEAAEWRLLGLLFACPHGDWHEQIAALAMEVRYDKLKSAARAALEEATESGYFTAFGPGGPAAPREVSHRQAALTGQYLAELLACYNAFAYRLSRDEPPDHIATEIDFIAYLRVKQAYAVARNDETQSEVTAQAIRSFIRDHLSTTAVPLTQSLAASGIPYLALAAATLSERVAPYCTNTVSSSAETNQICNPILPICDSSDCCAQLFD